MMTLAAGSRVGAYEIIGPLGAGGMGVVYRARDLRLKRDVALKVLAADEATAQPTGDDRRARLQREAELLAALNHPHIAQIYGVEDDGGRLALTMELVEGETLEEWIARGARPFADVRPVAMQIADALAYAHEHGIIHRDLKPSNIKVSSEGAAKVLDFGLAKATAADAGSREPGVGRTPDDSPTIMSPAGVTLRGTILGTAAYMAPEQARGAALDKRADIWAFGVVLFELLTGQRLFGGDTASDTLAAVLKNEPDFARVPPDTPPSIRRLLQRCLQKDRRRRLQDIGDARLELEDAAGVDDAPAGPAPSPPPPRGRVLQVLAVAAAAGAAAALVGVTLWPRPREEGAATSTPYRFSITQADGIPIGDPPLFAVSPDGRTMALRGSEGGVDYLYLRAFADGSVRRLSRSRGAGLTLAWSPDSQSLAFVRGGRLVRLSTTDAPPIEAPLSDEARAGVGQFGTGGIAWRADGTIVLGSRSGMVVASAAGGERVLSDPEHQYVMWPWFLPDGLVVNQRAGAASGTALYLRRSDGTGVPRRLEAGIQAQFVPPDRLLAVQGGRLFAWPFDAQRGEIAGEAVLVHDNVSQRMNIGRAFSASETGVLAVRNDVPVGSTRLAWFNRSGGEAGSLAFDQHCRNPELSPAFDRVAVECYEAGSTNRDVWLYDLSRDAAMRFTADRADDSDPVWSPDGRTILFASSRKGAPDVFQKSAGGAVPESLFFESSGTTYTVAWAPDGRHVALLELGTTAILDPATKETTPFGDGGVSTLIEPQFSPDGRWVSYSSDESGRTEIYVQPWPPAADKWQISTGGGTDARWRSDGRELYFLSPARELMAVSIDTANGFKAGAPARLFRTSIAGPLGSGHRFPYAVDKDGARFLMYVSDNQAPPRITVIVNWPALVEQQGRR
jgi:Tol biopolymer transport system component/predicted Ser/Thr protein kinase